MTGRSRFWASFDALTRSHTRMSRATRPPGSRASDSLSLLFAPPTAQPTAQPTPPPGTSSGQLPARPAFRHAWSEPRTLPPAAGRRTDPRPVKKKGGAALCCVQVKLEASKASCSRAAACEDRRSRNGSRSYNHDEDVDDHHQRRRVGPGALWVAVGDSPVAIPFHRDPVISNRGAKKQRAPSRGTPGQGVPAWRSRSCRPR